LVNTYIIVPKQIKADFFTNFDPSPAALRTRSKAGCRLGYCAQNRSGYRVPQKSVNRALAGPVSDTLGRSAARGDPPQKAFAKRPSDGSLPIFIFSVLICESHHSKGDISE